MQLLIVHQEVEIGEPLVSMMREYGWRAAEFGRLTNRNTSRAIKSWPELAAEARKLSTLVGPHSSLVSPKKTCPLKKARLWAKRG